MIKSLTNLKFNYMISIGVNELLKNLSDFSLTGDVGNITLNNFKTIQDADDQSLVWLKTSLPDKYELIHKTKARVIICGFDFDVPASLKEGRLFIHVKDPKLEYLRIIRTFTEKSVNYGIHPTAIVDNNAKIHANSWIGPFSYIGACEIGEGSIITGHCYIHDNIRIGKNVLIHAGVVIGSDGFGYSKNSKDELEKFPHIGGVIIDDNVEIGANTCIDRGTLGNTWIKEGAKIDNLVHIAHNVIIGKNAAVIANSMIGGSTIIEDFAWIAPSVSVMNGISVGKHATAGLGAVVTKTIPESETWAGSPARPIESFIKLQNELKKLI